jgi:hypothetical protein
MLPEIVVGRGGGGGGGRQSPRTLDLVSATDIRNDYTIVYSISFDTILVHFSSGLFWALESSTVESDT